MMPRPKIVDMPIWVPPNMATVPRTLPAADWLIVCWSRSYRDWSTIGSGMKNPIR